MRISLDDMWLKSAQACCFGTLRSAAGISGCFIQHEASDCTACLADYRAEGSESTIDCKGSHAGFPLSPKKARGAFARQRNARRSLSAWLMLALCMAAGLFTLCLLCGHFLPLLSTSPPAASAPDLDLSSLVASSSPRRLLDYTEVS